MRKIGHSLKSVKATCNLIFPKFLIVLGKWGAGRSQFHIRANFTNHFSIMFDFYKSLTGEKFENYICVCIYVYIIMLFLIFFRFEI